MISISYPDHSFKIRELLQGKEEIWDELRRSWVRLTPEEWRVMREHPVDGAELVSTMSRLRELVAAIKHHHENWDGTGYPNALAADEIPIGARIIRFADTIDAMATERPYRMALTHEQVRQEIVRCRGTQFDPEMTDRLLASPTWAGLFAPAQSLSGRAGLSIVRGAVQVS